MKHFEELWEKSELVALRNDKKTLEERVAVIQDKLVLLKEESTREENSRILGDILFQICGLSQKLNVNTFAALLKSMQDVQISAMEDE